MSLPSNHHAVQVLENGDIKIQAKNIDEAKVAIKELKLRKKQLALSKKELSNQIAQIRANYRLESAKRGSMMRGGGGLGKFVRGMEQINRNAARIQKEKSIDPLEKQKAHMDNIIG
jgi:hypothetical protein